MEAKLWDEAQKIKEKKPGGKLVDNKTSDILKKVGQEAEKIRRLIESGEDLTVKRDPSDASKQTDGGPGGLKLSLRNFANANNFADRDMNELEDPAVSAIKFQQDLETVTSEDTFDTESGTVPPAGGFPRLQRSPERRRSPARRRRSRSPGHRRRSRSPRRRRSTSRDRRRRGRRTISPRGKASRVKSRSKSPGRRNSRSPGRRRSRSPHRRSRSPMHRRSRSPGRRRSKSPGRRRQSRSPNRRRRISRSKSPKRAQRSHSPVARPRAKSPPHSPRPLSPPRDTRSASRDPRGPRSPFSTAQNYLAPEPQIADSTMISPSEVTAKPTGANSPKRMSLDDRIRSELGHMIGPQPDPGM